MTREALIRRTMDNIARLPDQNLMEVSDFADFLVKKIEDRLLTAGIQSLVAESDSFRFLESEPDIYSADDLKVRYK